MADDDQPKKKSKLGIIIILLLILLILGGGGGAAYYFLFAKKQEGGSETKATTEQTTTATVQTGEQPSTGFVKPLPTFIVNLADPLGKRFIKLDVELELNSAAAIQDVTKNESRIRDTLIMLLSSKTYADLTPMEGKMVLKNEILNRVNQILGGSKVVRVLITDMVIQ